MEMHGEQLVTADRNRTWAALNDPEVLKSCIPGCESITAISDGKYEVLMTARVGPVAAKFKGKLALSDVNPPESYSIHFEGQGGAAGFGKGSAKVKLADEGPHTRLSYDVTANVGGKLAQIGSRLVDGAAKKLAADFFDKFNEVVGRPAERPPASPDGGSPAAQPRVRWGSALLIAGAVVLVIVLVAWLGPKL